MNSGIWETIQNMPEGETLTLAPIAVTELKEYIERLQAQVLLGENMTLGALVTLLHKRGFDFSMELKVKDETCSES